MKGTAEAVSVKEAEGVVVGPPKSRFDDEKLRARHDWLEVA